MFECSMPKNLPKSVWMLHIFLYNSISWWSFHVCRVIVHPPFIHGTTKQSICIHKSCLYDFMKEEAKCRENIGAHRNNMKEVLTNMSCNSWKVCCLSLLHEICIILGINAKAKIHKWSSKMESWGEVVSCKRDNYCASNNSNLMVRKQYHSYHHEVRKGKRNLKREKD